MNTMRAVYERVLKEKSYPIRTPFEINAYHEWVNQKCYGNRLFHHSTGEVHDASRN